MMGSIGQCIVIAAVVLQLPLAHADGPQRTAYRAAHVVDGRGGEVLADHIIVVSGEHVVAVDPANDKRHARIEVLKTLCETPEQDR